MDIIPLIYLIEGKIRETKEGGQLTFDDVFKRVKDDTVLYVLDLDGIETNRPNLTLYKELSNHYILWIDAGPRVLEDVVDMIMAGATSITIRRNIWPTVDFLAIQELTEDEIYFALDQEHTNKHIEFSVFHDVIGAVVFQDEKQIHQDFKYGSRIKELAAKSKLYIYNIAPVNVPYWKEQNVAGVLVDINKIQGYK